MHSHEIREHHEIAAEHYGHASKKHAEHRG